MLHWAVAACLPLLLLLLLKNSLQSFTTWLPEPLHLLFCLLLYPYASHYCTVAYGAIIDAYASLSESTSQASMPELEEVHSPSRLRVSSDGILVHNIRTDEADYVFDETFGVIRRDILEAWTNAEHALSNGDGERRNGRRQENGIPVRRSGARRPQRENIR